MTLALGALQGPSPRTYDPAMPRKPSSERFVVGDLVPRADERAGWVAINHASAMPSRFTVDANLKEPPCTVFIDARVEPNGEILVKSLRIDVPMPGNASISTTSLRNVLVSQLVRNAVKRLAQPIEMLPEIHRGAFRVGDGPAAEVWVGPPAREGRGKQTPRERMIDAASRYRQAIARKSRSPVKDVAVELGFSESQTSRYLKAARLEGLLTGVPAPTPGLRLPSEDDDYIDTTPDDAWPPEAKPLSEDPDERAAMLASQGRATDILRSVMNRGEKPDDGEGTDSQDPA